MSLTRRTLLRGGISDTHVSSLVVHCQPLAVPALVASIANLEFAEVPEHCDSGKLVVLLETPGQSMLMDHISTIERLPGVISCALVYHHVDSEPDDHATEEG